MTLFAESTGFWFSYVALWCLVAFFGLLLLLLFRQFGIAFMRPLDRASIQGLDIGSKAPTISLDPDNGSGRSVIFEAATADKPTVLLFSLPTCAVCDRLAPDLADFPEQRPGVKFIWIDGQSPEPVHQAVIEAPGWETAISEGDRFHREWSVRAVPFGYIVGDDGRVKGKALVKRRGC